MKKKICLTGCAGFIGSNFVKKVATRPEIKAEYDFSIIDALTYAGHYQTIKNEVDEHDHLSFEKLDIRNKEKINQYFAAQKLDGVIHFAAESHVDNSIKGPNVFVETNVLGTLNLLDASLEIFKSKRDFRFMQISTDEVYGSLAATDPAFTEESPLKPSSPYSASKTSSDLLVQSYFTTYGLPTLISRCSNNYGPYQFPEKLIPVMIDKALNDKPLPMYGAGKNVRDWIHVDDHNEGVWSIFTKGKSGEVYNLGGACERANVDVIKFILKKLNKSESLIQSVPDRLGHDFRYAIDFKKAQSELSWEPKITFEVGLSNVIDWYQNNQGWVESVLSKSSANME